MGKTENKEKSVIVLNAMYSGGYLNENMGHEIINLFKSDKAIMIGGKSYQNFLYLNPYGNFNQTYEDVVTDMLMVISVPKKNMFEIVGKASGLVDVFKPVNGFNPKLDGEKSEIQINAEKEVANAQEEIIKNITYGEKSLTSLFGDDKQQSIYVTYVAEQVCRPKVRMFIKFLKDQELPVDQRIVKKEDRVELTLTSAGKEKQAQKQYFDRCSNEEAEKNDAVLLDELLNGDYWMSAEESTSIVSRTEKCKLRKDSLFNICRIEDNELVFSNAFAFYIRKYPHLFSKIFKYNGDKISIEREWNHIDIFIKVGNQRIIIENKIHSGINCNKNESDYNKTNPQLKRSQLGRYWSEACKEVDENNVTAYLLCPEYKSKELEIEKGGYETGKRYKVISYKSLYEDLNVTGESKNDGNFKDFIDALYKQTFDSIPKIKYEDMKNTFFTRIKELREKEQ